MERKSVKREMGKDTEMGNKGEHMIFVFKFYDKQIN